MSQASVCRLYGMVQRSGKLPEQVNRVLRKAPCGTAANPLRPSISPPTMVNLLFAPQILALRIAAEPLQVTIGRPGTD